MEEEIKMDVTGMKMIELKEELRLWEIDETGDRHELQKKLIKVRSEHENWMELLREKKRTVLNEEDTEQGEITKESQEEDTETFILEKHQYVPQIGQGEPTVPGMAQIMQYLQDMMKQNQENATQMQENAAQVQEKVAQVQENVAQVVQEKVAQVVQEKVTQIQENVAKKMEKTQEYIQNLAESLSKRYEAQEKKIAEVESKVEVIETGMRQLEERIDIEVQTKDVQIKQMDEIISKQIDDLGNKQTRDHIKTNRRITDLETDVKQGFEQNSKIMEEENLRLQATLRKEMQEKMRLTTEPIGQVNGTETSETFKKEMEKRLNEMQRQLQAATEAKTTGEYGTPLHLSCVGKLDDTVKFCGDYRKIHPMNFIKTIKNKSRKIVNIDDLKEYLRMNLTGQALLWLNCKETEINSLDDFEYLFKKTFWGEIQQAKVRERLYFGKFDPQRSNSLTNYALQVYAQIQHLTPGIAESEIVMFISRHYKQEIAEIIAINNIIKFDQLVSYLSRIERNLDSNLTNRVNNRQNNNFNSNNARTYNSIINNHNQNRNNAINDNFKRFQSNNYRNNAGNNNNNSGNGNFNRSNGNYNNNNNFNKGYYGNNNGNNYQNYNNNYTRNNNGNYNNNNQNMGMQNGGNNNYRGNYGNNNYNNNGNDRRNTNYQSNNNNGRQNARVNHLNTTIQHRSRSVEARDHVRAHNRSSNRARSSDDGNRNRSVSPSHFG